jgi:uncharacterized membrane protein YdjX (TVP38/TMEM64 family)
LFRTASFAAASNGVVAPKRSLSLQPHANLPLSGFPLNGVTAPARDSQLQESQGSLEGERTSRFPVRKVALAVFAITALSVGFGRRQDINHLFSQVDLSGVHRWLLITLIKLNETGNAGLALYAFLFALWTITVGVTTPIETAGGFVFGAKRAIIANSFGTLGGALVAFFLGRFIFYDAAHKRLKDNEILQLVEESIEENPLLVALMVRLAPLPEPVKNLGMSVLGIKNRYFVASVFLHGFPFTVLWSCLGAETAKVVTLGAAPSATLTVLVSASTWFGTLQDLGIEWL